MRRGTWLGCVLWLVASVGWAETVPDPLETALTKCDLCLAAIAETVPPDAEAGADRFIEFRVEQEFFRSVQLGKQPGGVPTRLTVTLRRGTPAVAQGEKYVLFLQRTGPAVEPVWVTAADGPGVSPYSEALARTLEDIGRRLTAAGAEPRRIGRQPPPVNLVGEWLLTLPAGFEYSATIEPTGTAGEYRVKSKAVNLCGVYRLEGQRLTVTEPTNKKLKGLVWDVLNNNALMLIEQPIPSPVSADYRRATLTRLKSVVQ
jgi:hypothetical protein